MPCTMAPDNAPDNAPGLPQICHFRITCKRVFKAAWLIDARMTHSIAIIHLYPLSESDPLLFRYVDSANARRDVIEVQVIATYLTVRINTIPAAQELATPSSKQPHLHCHADLLPHLLEQDFQPQYESQVLDRPL